jgi:hypothetical protein
MGALVTGTLGVVGICAVALLITMYEDRRK